MANLGEWTVYDSETGDAVEFTAFLGAEVSNESKVITSPVEQGSFVAYNKVHSPAELTVTGAVKGEPADLTQAMELLDEMCNGTRLYNIVTPDRVYRDYNLYKLSYRRSVDDHPACTPQPQSQRRARAKDLHPVNSRASSSLRVSPSFISCSTKEALCRLYHLSRYRISS